LPLVVGRQDITEIIRGIQVPPAGKAFKARASTEDIRGKAQEKSAVLLTGIFFKSHQAVFVTL
jgi:hypothetical protein